MGSAQGNVFYRDHGHWRRLALEAHNNLALTRATSRVPGTPRHAMGPPGTVPPSFLHGPPIEVSGRSSGKAAVGGLPEPVKRLPCAPFLPGQHATCGANPQDYMWKRSYYCSIP